MDSEMLKNIIEELASVKDAILENWKHFAFIIIVYTIIVVRVVSLYYKHKQENLEYREQTLLNKIDDFEKQREECEKIKTENEAMKKELSSLEYTAYLASKGKCRNNLDDSNIFN